MVSLYYIVWRYGTTLQPRTNSHIWAALQPYGISRFPLNLVCLCCIPVLLIHIGSAMSLICVNDVIAVCITGVGLESAVNVRPTSSSKVCNRCIILRYMVD